MSAGAQRRVAVLASGSGSNLQALIDSDGGKISLLICNVPGAGCLERARRAEIPSLLLDHRDYPSRDAFDTALIAALRQHRIELVALAGFMRLLTPAFLNAFPLAVLNVHPALLPAFRGMHAVQQALDYGVKVTGCTVHFVDEGTDTGPIIAQATVAVHASDDAASLQARIQAEEHLVFPQVVWDVAHGRVLVTGRKVTFGEAAT